MNKLAFRMIKSHVKSRMDRRKSIKLFASGVLLFIISSCIVSESEAFNKLMFVPQPHLR